MGVPVLHVCDKFGVRGSSIHGVSRLFSWWFPRYDPARYEVSLCGLKRPEAATRWLEEQGIGVRHLGRGRFDPRILGDLVALARERGARILHVHGYAAADFGRLAARAAGAKLVLHEHFADPRMPAYQALADRLLRHRTDGAIAVSRSTREFLVHERFVPPERVRLIWNGAPLDEFAPAPRDRALHVRRELGFPDEALVVGSIGRLNAQKGHRFLVEAAGRLLPSRPRARVLIVGDGDLMFGPGILWTAAHERIPLLYVVHNNRCYHMEIMQMQVIANRRQRGIDRVHIGCRIDDPNIDYAAMAKSLGVCGEGPIENPRDLGPALKRAIAVVKKGEPALVDVVSQGR